MLTEEDDVEIHALAARGWSVSAISRHTGRDRKTVRRYLVAPRGALLGRERAASCLEPFRAYVEARFADDPHLEVTVLHRELVDAGFERSYPTLLRELRRLELRPTCVVCRHRRGDAVTVEIGHPPGEEVQWDWLELTETPWGEPAYVLIGALSHSGRFRGVLCEQMTFGHLAGAVHDVLVKLGGTPRVWRTDRMATIVVPGTDRLTVEAAQLAKHYGVEIAVCPPRRAQRKGVVEAAAKYTTRSWWRTAQVATIGEAQRDLDAWSVRVADQRERRGPFRLDEPGRLVEIGRPPEPIGDRGILGRSEVRDGYVDALGRQGERDAAPDPSGRSGDERDLAGEFHGTSLTPSAVSRRTKNPRAPSGAKT